VAKDRLGVGHPGSNSDGPVDWCSRCGDLTTSHVYSMRMARVNLTVPDDLLEQARAAGLNVSRLAAAALADELDRRARIVDLDAYLAELDAEYGPVPAEEAAAAAAWADRMTPATSRVERAGVPARSRSVRPDRSA
jgi:enamine deaminase RidA (YjgF/YER057c/UK114 family)